MPQKLLLLPFLVLVVGGGLVIGWVARPGPWYLEIAKPGFTPPGWLFGPVWTMLYVMIAVAGWRTWRRERGGWAMQCWWSQLAFNFLWSPFFFMAHQIGAALAVALMMFAAILGFIVTSWRHDRTAAMLFLPYAAWVGFASFLNWTILTLNA